MKPGNSVSAEQLQARRYSNGIDDTGAAVAPNTAVRQAPPPLPRSPLLPRSILLARPIGQRTHAGGQSPPVWFRPPEEQRSTALHLTDPTALHWLCTGQEIILVGGKQQLMKYVDIDYAHVDVGSTHNIWRGGAVVR